MILLDSGASLSACSHTLLPSPVALNNVAVKGIGGTARSGNAVPSTVGFSCGLTYQWAVKPIETPDDRPLVILGQDFMSQFGHTLFDWQEGKVRIGKDWIWALEEPEPLQLPCKFDPSSCCTLQLSQLNELLTGFVDLFATNPKSPRECRGVEHEIPLSESRVCVDKVRRIPSKFLELVDTQVQEMLENGIIRESVSSYNSNPLLVDKKGGEKRFVVDFRSLNKITVRDNYPIPHVDDIIEKTRGSKFYTELDLASGYWCVPLQEGDKHTTAFSVPRGKFEFNRLPFGMNNSQATFQRMVDNIVKKARQRGAYGLDAYVDNFFIFTKTFEEHMIILQIVMEELRVHNLTLRADKCKIAFKELDILGIHVSENSISPSEENVEKLLVFPAPTTKRKIQQFLGLANFNRRFVRQYAELTKPLTTLLSKEEKFKWGDGEQQAFEKIKQCLGTRPVLTIPDWNRPFHVDTDASGVATGAILYQVEDDGTKCPIYYHSRTLTAVQRKWSATERELYAMVDAARKFRVYCTNKTVFHTDHEPLKTIRNQRDPRGKIGRWLMELESIDCSISYLPGIENSAADCLSRQDSTVSEDPSYEKEADDLIYTAYSTPKDLLLHQQADHDISSAVKQLKAHSDIKKGPLKRYKNGLKVSENGILMKGWRIVVPKNLEERVILDYHGQSHAGPEITAATIRERFWFKAVLSKTENVVSQCQTCRKTRRDNPNKAELVIDFPEYKPWETIAMDVGSMPISSRGNIHFLLIVDMSSKFTAAIPLPHQRSGLIKAALWKAWFGVFGAPKTLLSDQAKNMDGETIKQLCRELRIKKRRSSPYHPEGNGSAERAIGLLKSRLSAMCEARQVPISDWDLLISEATLLVNSQRNKSLGYPPFKLVFGRDSRLPVDNHYDLDQIGVDYPPEVAQADAKANQRDARISYKATHDRKAGSKEVLKVGDIVLLKRNYGDYPKMAVKWESGPYTLMKQVGPVNWVVENKKGVQKVYHQNLLKPAGSRKEPEFSVEHSPYSLKNAGNVHPHNHRINVHVSPEPSGSLVEHTRQGEVLDRNGFTENVFRNPHPQPLAASPEADEQPRSTAVVTRSGRISRPVLGNRLIDNVVDP